MSVAAFVHIAVAVDAVLLESQKAFLADRQELDVRVRMTLVTSDRQVLSLQLKIETLVPKVKCILHARQFKAACVGDCELVPVMFRMTRRAVGGQVTGQVAVEATTEH